MDCKTVRDFKSWNQAEIKSCVNTLSPPKGEPFRILTKRIGIRAAALQYHKTSEFFQSIRLTFRN
jgi:hypothetical protein